MFTLIIASSLGFIQHRNYSTYYGSFGMDYEECWRFISHPLFWWLLGPPGSMVCQQNFNTFISLCADLGVPLAADISEGPSMLLCKKPGKFCHLSALSTTLQKSSVLEEHSFQGCMLKQQSYTRCTLSQDWTHYSDQIYYGGILPFRPGMVSVFSDILRYRIQWFGYKPMLQEHGAVQQWWLHTGCSGNGL